MPAAPRRSLAARSPRRRGAGSSAGGARAAAGDRLRQRLRVYQPDPILPGSEIREARYLYQGGHVGAETDAAGNIKWKYTWGPGTDNLIGLQDSTGTQYYVVQDQLGSVRGLVKRDGTWIMHQRFTPYGALLARDSAGSSMPRGFHVGWTGREYDAETGFTFHRARYYSPDLRRWTQEDPIGSAGGGNLYAYVGGAVMEARDPSGLMEDLSGRGLGFAEASRPNENYELPPWPGGGGKRGGWLNSSHIEDDGYLDRLMDATRKSQLGHGKSDDDDPAVVACKANPVCNDEYGRFTAQGGNLVIKRVQTFPEWFEGCDPNHRPCSVLSGDGSGSFELEVRMVDAGYAWQMLGSTWGGRVDWAIYLAHELAEANGGLGGFSPADAHHYALLVEDQARRTNREYYGHRRAP